MKKLNIKFQFYQEEWDEYKEYYSDKKIREILLEGGIGELNQLISNYKRGANEEKEKRSQRRKEKVRKSKAKA